VTPVPLLANPAAGGGRCGRRLPQAMQRLRDLGLDPHLHRTHGPGHARELAPRLAVDHDTLLIAGGDGTTFEALDGLLGADGPVPALGLLPLGTGNSFLRDLAIDDIEAAYAAIARQTPRRVDAVRMTHTEGVLHYLNLFSIGFTSRVGATTNRWFKPLGAGGYTVATLVETARLRAEPFPHAIDDGPPDSRPYTFLSFSNSRCTGGAMQMAPDAVIDDGQLDLVRIGVLSRTELLRLFPRIYAGEHLTHPANDAVRASRVDLDLPGPLPCMIDGEVLTLQPTSLEVVPGAVEILA